MSESLHEQSSEIQTQTSPELAETLLNIEQPFGVDWRKSALDMNMSSRLLRLARVKAILPPTNAIDEKSTHDVTLENYIRLALQSAGDRDTISIFLDHIKNVLVINSDRAWNLAQQVFWIWAPVAEIAGLYNHKAVLEDLAFKTMLPEEDIKIREQYDKAMLEGEYGLLKRVSTKISELINEGLAPGMTFSLLARPKGIYSVWRKLRNEDRDNPQLFDLLGLRAIIDGDEQVAINQCYAAMAAVAGEFQPDKSRVKDYIRHPKATGYQSLHLTLYTASGFPFELQIRTRSMHNYAESDKALSHQTYEATYKEIPGKIKQTFRKIPKLYQWRNTATAFIGDNDGITEGAIGDEILFFRPDGNLYRAPSGINALDASFRIHSHRALRTRSIFKNGAPAKFKSVINFGDLVQVNYWPKYSTVDSHYDRYSQLVTTAYAKSAIERSRRVDHSSRYQALGKLVILKIVGNVGLNDPLSVLDQKDRRELADRVGVTTFDHLLELIGAGIQGYKPSRIANYVLNRLGIGEKLVLKPKPETTGKLTNNEVLEHLVIPSTGGQPECRVAGCCSERIARGDIVLARPSRFEAVMKIHLFGCVNVRDLSDVIICDWLPQNIENTP